MANGQVISFKVQDTNVVQFMDSIKRKSQELSQQLFEDAKKQSTSSQEQLKFVQEKIKALERQSKLDRDGSKIRLQSVAEERTITSQARIAALRDENQRKLDSGEISRPEFKERKKRIAGLEDKFGEDAIQNETASKINNLKKQSESEAFLANHIKDFVEAVKMASHETVEAIKEGNTEQVNASQNSTDETKRLGANIALEGQKKKKDGEKEPTESVLNKILTFTNAIGLDRVTSLAAQAPSAKNELDYIKPMLELAGMMSGGLLGNAADAIAGVKVLGTGVGQTSFAQLGTQVGLKAGEFFGSSVERTFRQRDELTTGNFKLKALGGNVGAIEAFGNTGEGLGGRGYISNITQNFEKFGIGMIEASKLQYELAMRAGDSRNLSRDSRNVLGLQNGLGVRQETSMMLMEMVRSNSERDRNIGQVIGGVLEKDGGKIFKNGDRSFLNEFLTRNYSQVQKGLLQTQNRVASGTPLDIIEQFNTLGGQFNAKDSRSGGLISTIQSNLSNPSSDSMKALAFQAMRQAHPEMSYLQIQKEIQKGLGSEDYMKVMSQTLRAQGGDESYQANLFGSAFGLSGNLDAADAIAKGTFRNFDQSELKGTGRYSTGAINALGENQTSVYSRSSAEIENAFTDGALKGISMVETKMLGLFGSMLDALKAKIVTMMEASFNDKTPPKVQQNQFGANTRDQIYRSK